MYTSDEESDDEEAECAEVAHYLIHRHGTRAAATALFHEQSKEVVHCPFKFPDEHDVIHCTGVAGGFELFSALHAHVTAKARHKCPYHQPLLRLLNEIMDSAVIMEAGPRAGPSRPVPIKHLPASKPIPVEGNVMPPRLVLHNVPAKINDVGILEHVGNYGSTVVAGELRNLETAAPGMLTSEVMIYNAGVFQRQALLTFADNAHGYRAAMTIHRKLVARELGRACCPNLGQLPSPKKGKKAMNSNQHKNSQVYGWLATSSDLHKLKKFQCLRDIRWECKPEEEMAKIRNEAFPEVKKPSSSATTEAPSEKAWAEAEQEPRGANGLTQTESTKGLHEMAEMLKGKLLCAERQGQGSDKKIQQFRKRLNKIEAKLEARSASTTMQLHASTEILQPLRSRNMSEFVEDSLARHVAGDASPIPDDELEIQDLMTMLLPPSAP